LEHTKPEGVGRFHEDLIVTSGSSSTINKADFKNQIKHSPVSCSELPLKGNKGSQDGGEFSQIMSCLIIM
jgi:hypothetical protein